MIGKTEWFIRRKWAGWGVFPVTWQGWVYTLIFVVLIFATRFIPGASEETKIVALVVIGAIMFVDVMDIMVRMKKDERETLHEALAERNALWVAVIVLAGGVAYQAASGAASGAGFGIDPVILIALFGALIAKAATNFYLDRHD